MDAGRSSSDSRERDLIRAAEHQEFSPSGGTWNAETVASPSMGRGTGRPLPDIIPGYDILREIHRGGQGVVYQGVQHATRRKVAIKVMKEGAFADDREIARFEREVQVLGQLDHPNIVNIRDTGQAAGSSYFVMDYISGAALDEHLSVAGKKIREVLELFVEICDAVNAAHLHGVVHRDLKPSNIRVDSDGRPYILDFGLAKTANTDSDGGVMTMTGQFVGSLPWASPEQAEGAASRIDIRSDVYSIGVILYHTLTGCFPYEVTGNMRDVIDHIMTSPPHRPRTLSRSIDDEIETILLKALSKERERRYQSAGELGRDLARYLAGDAIEAKRDSSWYLLRKTVSRFRLQAAVATAFCALITGFGIWMAVLYREANDLRVTTEEINRFLVKDLLGSTLPEVAVGREITVQDVLGTASRRIDDAFPDQPAVEAALRLTLGQCYIGLGLYPDARGHIERALDLRSRTLGREHLDTLTALSALADLHNREGHYSVAEEMFSRAVATSTHLRGPEHVATLEARSSLALTHRYQGRHDAAEAELREIVDVAMRRGLETEEALGWMHKLAAVLVDQGRDDEAAPLYDRVIDGYRRVLGAQHPTTLTAMNDLAGVHLRGEHFERARSLLEDVLAAQRAILGPGHARTVATMINLATVYSETGLREEAEPLFVQALETRRTTLGSDHPATLNSMHNLAMFYSDAARYAEAEPLYRATLAARRTTLGPTHRSTLISLAKLGELYTLIDNPVRGEPLLREALDGAQRDLADHPYYGIFQRAYGECLSAQGRFEEAAPILRESHSRLSTHFGPRHGRTRKACEALAHLYESWGRPKDAVAWRALARE